jgi:hypothetical protein
METVKVEMDFLKHHKGSIGNMEKYLVYTIIYSVESDLDATDNGPFFHADHEIEKWGLGEVFKKYDC